MRLAEPQLFTQVVNQVCTQQPRDGKIYTWEIDALTLFTDHILDISIFLVYIDQMGSLWEDVYTGHYWTMESAGHCFRKHEKG